MRLMMPALCGALTVVCPAIALAHVTLEAEEAAAGSFYKAVLRVGHG
jgi:periplasmic copper chaperone A